MGISIEDINLSKTQISDRDYKIRMFKVIEGKKGVMREKETIRETNKIVLNRTLRNE